MDFLVDPEAAITLEDSRHRRIVLSGDNDPSMSDPDTTEDQMECTTDADSGSKHLNVSCAAS